MPFKLTKIAPFLFVWLWSTGFVGAKYGLPYIEPFFMLLVRFIIVIGVFWLLILIFKSQWLTSRQSWQQFCIGLLIHGGYLGGVFFGIKQGIPAGVAAIIVGLQPLLTSLVGWLILKQRVHYAQLSGLLLGFIGVALVIFEKFNFSDHALNKLGLAACFSALFCISIGTVLQKQLAEKVSLLSGSFFQYIGATLVVLVLTLSFETQQVEYSLELFLSMTWLIIALSVIAVLLLLYMIREGEVAKVTSYFYLVPPVAVIQTWLIFDESMGLMSVLGTVLSVIGVYFVVKKSLIKISN